MLLLPQGFNNNFHIRTHSYLATLYNDRSVLENHHCTCIFDLVKNPAYNIFASMSWEQYKDIRDTMLEMVLSTDMGLHAKIYQTFRRRLNEDKEWGKEETRLAMTIAIKMADISNCCRPRNIYQVQSRSPRVARARFQFSSFVCAVFRFHVLCVASVGVGQGHCCRILQPRRRRSSLGASHFSFHGPPPGQG